MKAWFKAEDEMEAKRFAKADDMAIALWQIVHNGWRDFKHTDYDHHKAWKKIHEILDEYGIDVDDLTE